MLTVWSAEHFQYLENLVALEWQTPRRLLSFNLGFLSFEDGSQTGQFGEDTSDGPAVNGFVVMFGAHEQLGRAIPDGDDDFIAGMEGL